MEKYDRVKENLRKILSVRYIKKNKYDLSIFDDKKMVNSDIELDTDIYRYKNRDYFREIYRINTKINFDSDTDTDTDSYLYNYTDSDSDSDPDADIKRVREMEKFIKRDLYLKDLYDLDEDENIFKEAYNDEYDLY